MVTPIPKLITPNTTLLGLVGDKIVSNAERNAVQEVFNTTGYDGAYVTFSIKPEHLEMTLNGMRTSHISRIDIAPCYDTNIIPLLDTCSKEVVQFGFCDHIHILEGKLNGSLLWHKTVLALIPSDSPVILWGAGRYTAALLSLLTHHNISIVVKTPEETLGLEGNFDVVRLTDNQAYGLNHNGIVVVCDAKLPLLPFASSISVINPFTDTKFFTKRASILMNLS